MIDQAKQAGQTKPTVFVSYSHKDKEHLDALLPHLKALELNEHIEVWHDTLIGIGENWYGKLQDKMADANAAVLLISANFLSSKFCKYEEMPILLQRQRRGELAVLPLLVNDCLWEDEPWLKRLQIIPGEKPLARQGKERDLVLKELARQVRDIAINGVKPPQTALQRWPIEAYDFTRLPETGSLLFGRRKELALLDEAWDSGVTNVIAFTAGGGVGKSTLARVWVEMLAEEKWRGAERAFAWSFYSQGTGRMTDAEGFISEALKWFGDKTPEGLSPWDRGERLAQRVRERRTLLILDGVEPLQSGDEGVDKGSIRDPGLQTLLEELARDNPGLCVVTTRESLSDLKEHGAPVVLHEDLDQVSRLAGRALLRVDRIIGDDELLEAAVEGIGGHALAVSLLSNFLTDDNPAPHISNASALPELKHPVRQGGHPRRVLDAWAKRLGSSAELELLQIIGLFDRPADRSAIQFVIDGDQFPGLNEYLQKASLDDVVKRLRKARLIARQSTHDDTIDTHPIIREHFGQRLKNQHPKSSQAGHRRLYEYYKYDAENQPNDLAGMQPLFAAVVHGCAAGLHQEVRREIYRNRIDRGHEYYLTHKLGAFAADLSCLSQFFTTCWTRPAPTFSGSDQAWLIGNIGFDLRGLGRLREALETMEEALRRRTELADWKYAAREALNLSGLYGVLGELAQSVARAQDAVDYADRSSDELFRMATRAILAGSLHQLGRASDSRALFAEAERMQAEREPEYPYLHGFQGYHYCDFLLDQGQADEVRRRVKLFFEWQRPTASLLTIALDHLCLGRAHMAALESDPAAAEEHLRAAVDGLRVSGSSDDVPRGLLARAGFYCSQSKFDLAQLDLDKVRIIVRRTGMRLYAAGLELEQTRWHLAKNDRDAARENLDKARELVESMNYGRLRPEVKELEAKLA